MEDLNADRLIRIFKLDSHEPSEQEDAVVIPANVDVLKTMLNIGNHNNQVVQKNLNFSEDAVKLLVDHRLELNDLFRDCGDFFGLAAFFWEYIADKITETGFKTTGGECSKKWEQLYNRYMKIVHNSSRSEADDLKYFDDFERIFKAREQSRVELATTEEAPEETPDQAELKCPNEGESRDRPNGNNDAKKTELQTKICDRRTTNVVTESEIEDAVQFIEKLNNVQIENIENEMVSNIPVCPNGYSLEKVHNNPKDIPGSQSIIVYAKNTDFSWDGDSTQCFLDQRLNIEKVLRAGNYNGPNPDIYMSTKMALYGYQITAEECQKKWHEFMTLYTKNVELIKETGDLLETWKYLWQMDKILKDPGLSGVANRQDFVWTKDAIVELIKIRLPMENAFITFKKYIALWEHVALLMTERSYPVSYNECSMKWSELYENYENRLNTIRMEEFHASFDPLLEIHHALVENAIRDKTIIEYYATNANLQNQSNVRHTNSRTLSTNSFNVGILDKKEANRTQRQLTERKYIIQSSESRKGTRRDVEKPEISVVRNIAAMEMERQPDDKEAMYIRKHSQKQRKCPLEFDSIAKRTSLNEEQHNLNEESEGTTTGTLSFTDSSEDNEFGYQLEKQCTTQHCNSATQMLYMENHGGMMTANPSCSSKQSQLERTAISTSSLVTNSPNSASQVSFVRRERLQQSDANSDTTESGLNQIAKKLSIGNDKDTQVVFKWTRDSTLMLIKLRLAWDSQFKIWGTDRFYWWNMIAEIMHMSGYNVSHFSCESQWIHLMSAYYRQNMNSNEIIQPEYRKYFELIDTVFWNGLEGVDNPKVDIKVLEPDDQKCLSKAQRIQNSKYFWTDEAVKTLVALKHSDACPEEGTMKWIAKKMQMVGYHSLTPVICSRKWHRMCSMYKNLILRRKLGKPIKWQYFEMMDRYFKKWNIDSKKRMSRNRNAKPFDWSKNAIQSLIKFRMSLEDLFRKPDAQRTLSLWQRIAASMEEVGFPVTPQESATKWNSLMSAYTQIKDDLQNECSVVIGEHLMEIHEAMLQRSELESKHSIQGNLDEPLDLSRTAMRAYYGKRPLLPKCNVTNNVRGDGYQYVTDSNGSGNIAEMSGNAKRKFIGDEVSLKDKGIVPNLPIKNKADFTKMTEHVNSNDSLRVPRHKSDSHSEEINCYVILSKDVASTRTKSSADIPRIAVSKANSNNCSSNGTSSDKTFITCKNWNCIHPDKATGTTGKLKNLNPLKVRDGHKEIATNQDISGSIEAIESLLSLSAETNERGNKKMYVTRPTIKGSTRPTIKGGVLNSNESLVPHHHFNGSSGKNSCKVNLSEDVESSRKGVRNESSMVDLRKLAAGSCPKSTPYILENALSIINSNCNSNGSIPNKTFSVDGCVDEFDICENLNSIQTDKESNYAARLKNLTCSQARDDSKTLSTCQKTCDSTGMIKSLSVLPGDTNETEENKVYDIFPSIAESTLNRNITNSSAGTTDEEMVSIPNTKIGHIWSKLSTHLLIDFRVYHEIIYPGCPRSEIMWSKIASQLDSAGYYYKSQECERKWENLVSTYEKIIQDMQVRKEMLVWPYFEKLDWIFKKSAGQSNKEYKVILPKDGLKQSQTTQAKNLKPTPKKRTESSTSSFVSKYKKLN